MLVTYIRLPITLTILQKLCKALNTLNTFIRDKYIRLMMQTMFLVAFLNSLKLLLIHSIQYYGRMWRWTAQTVTTVPFAYCSLVTNTRKVKVHVFSWTNMRSQTYALCTT